MSHATLLACGLIVLIAADLVLTSGRHWWTIVGGVGLWGTHMGMTQGLLATMVADTRGVRSCMQQELRVMERQGSGAIVNNASVGALRGNPGIAGGMTMQ